MFDDETQCRCLIASVHVYMCEKANGEKLNFNGNLEKKYHSEH